MKDKSLEKLEKKVNNFFKVDSYIGLEDENEFLSDNNLSLETINERKFYITDLEENLTFKEILDVHNKIIEFRELIPTVEGNSLDNNQILSIVNEKHNNLIIAGAGSGKTTTIIGKVKYLILKYNVEAKDILILSFTNASSKEMKERIEKEVKTEIQVNTFHKLGYDIVKSTLNEDLKVYTDKLENLILSILNQLFNDVEYYTNFVNYFLKENKLKYYLYALGISFQYDECNSEYYLFEYNIFISEKSKRGNIYFDKDLNKLVETFKLMGIKCRLKSVNYLWEMLNIEENFTFKVVNYLITVISLIKSNNYSLSGFKKIIDNDSIYKIISPVYLEYNKYLEENNLIDYSDMINKATSLIKENKYIHNFKYVIVDEFQDTSMCRYNLLMSMRNQKDYNLFCVGDDYQSIYRFSGSDVSLITNFSKYFGEVYVSKIVNTYRFSDKMAKLSSEFVMKNKSQIRKVVKGYSSTNEPIEIIYSMSELENVLKGLPNYSSVFLLGRYNSDKDILKSSENFSYNYGEILEVIYSKRIDLEIKYLTIHKSKGLQADYVFIINNKDKGSSFPSKIVEDTVIEKLLGIRENYPFSEERRLLYVALTRSKVKTYLLVEKGNASVFIKELIKDYKIDKKIT